MARETLNVVIFVNPRPALRTLMVLKTLARLPLPHKRKLRLMYGVARAMKPHINYRANGGKWARLRMDINIPNLLRTPDV